MDCMVHGVTKSQTRLSNFHFISLHVPETEGVQGPSSSSGNHLPAPLDWE